MIKQGLQRHIGFFDDQSAGLPFVTKQLWNGRQPLRNKHGSSGVLQTIRLALLERGRRS